MTNYTRVLALAASGDASGLLLKLRSETPLVGEDFERLAGLIEPLLPAKLSHERPGRPRKTVEQKLQDGLTIGRAVGMYDDRAADWRKRRVLYGRKNELIAEVAAECGVTESHLRKKLSQRRKVRIKSSQSGQ